MKRILLPGFAIGIASALIAACGSGSGGSTGTGSSGVTISAITGPNHLQIGVNSSSTYVYSATVSGGSNTSITWSVSDTSLATIGPTTGVATPSVTKTGTMTISATANADTTKTSTIQVQVVDWILAGQVQYYDGLPVGQAVALMNSDGTDPVTLIPFTLLPSPFGYFNCVWAHDHLRFACFPFPTSSGPPTQLVIFQTDGTAAGTGQVATVDLVSLGFPGYFGNAHFAPDGSEIVFEGQTSGPGGLVVAGTYVVAATGKSPPVLLATDTSGYDVVVGNPRFTPNGAEILYSQGGTVWIMSADGSNQRQLLSITSQNAEYSPDMSALYYQMTSGVYMADADGSNPVNIAGSAYTFDGVSPNGDSILLLTSAPLGSDGVYTADAQGGNLQGLNASDWAAW